MMMKMTCSVIQKKAMHTQVLIPLATLEDAIDVFHAKVVNELASYDRFWSEVETDMKWEGMVDEFPTPLAISLKSSKMIDVEKMGCNPRYLWTLFDVMKWWTVHGAKLYPKLAVAHFGKSSTQWFSGACIFHWCIP